MFTPPTTDLNSISDADVEATRRAFVEAFTNGNAIERTQRIRRKDGVYRLFLVRHVPMTGSDGRVVRWYGSATDIYDLAEWE